jgi:mono/diheme cytochrome c family protein
MSLYAKSILAIVLLGFAFVAALSMLTLMGRTQKKGSPVFLRRLHKISGGMFAILFLVISYFCLHYVKMAGDAMSTRAVFHGVLALFLFAVLALKLSIAQFYRQFLRYVPGMGMTVFSLALVVFLISAGYFLLVTEEPKPTGEPAGQTSSPTDAQKGAVLFDSKCSFCHYADKTTAKLGPGLEGVLKRETLPVSGRPATPENIERQLLTPYQNMPAVGKSLSSQEIKDLMAYLKTL